MDIMISKADLKAEINSNVLQVKMCYDFNLFQGKLAGATNLDLPKIKQFLEQKCFTISKKSPTTISIKIKQIIEMELHHCCSKHWILVGTFNDLDTVLKTHPTTHYEYGTLYNGPTIMRIIINNWNKGLRIITADEYPQGDNAQTMKPGRSMWTKGTLDQLSQKGDWYHQYVDSTFKQTSSNGNMNLQLYAKKY